MPRVGQTGSALTMALASYSLDFPVLPSWAVTMATLLLTFASGMK